jgi:uncharacterized membrane protein YfcA
MEWECRLARRLPISLVSVGLTSFVGFLGKWRKGEAELRTGLLFAVAGMLGAPIGSWIGRQIPEAWLMLMLSGLMLTIAWKMWQKSSRVPLRRRFVFLLKQLGLQPDDYAKTAQVVSENASGQLILTSRCARLLLIVGVASGILSGMFGVGGGFIIVPALILFSSMSMSRAVGTSLMVISLVSASGIVSQLWIGQSITLGITPMFAVGRITWAGSGAVGCSSAFGLHAAASVFSRHSPGGRFCCRQKSFVEAGSMSQTIHHQVVVVGGGTAGISVAARLTNGWFNKRDVAMIEPADTHYYQPLWTLVGGGVVPKEVTGRPMKSVMPKRVHWIKDAVAEFEPDRNTD